MSSSLNPAGSFTPEGIELLRANGVDPDDPEAVAAWSEAGLTAMDDYPMEPAEGAEAEVVEQADGSKIQYIGTTTIPARRVSEIFEQVRESHGSAVDVVAALLGRVYSTPREPGRRVHSIRRCSSKDPPDPDDDDSHRLRRLARAAGFTHISEPLEAELARLLRRQA